MTAQASGGYLSLLRRELGYWRLFRKVAREVNAAATIDAVILPYIDYCYYACGVLGVPLSGRPWCAISMRLSVERHGEREKARRPWKWLISQRMLADRTCKSLFVINPSVRHMPSGWFSAERALKIRYLPDPAELPVTSVRSEARDALGLPERALAILVFGSIDERKGVDLLLAALTSTGDLKDCVVILAGSQSEGVRTLLDTPGTLELRAQGRLLAFDRYIDQAEQARVFAASDVVWVGYRNHAHMSGVLVLAGKAGLPALGTAQGEIGQLIGENALGAVAPGDRPDDIAAALQSLLDENARSEAGRRIAEFFQDHTIENFGNTVLSAFESERA